MLTGGFYAEMDLGYDATIAQEKGRPPVPRSSRSGRSSFRSATSSTRSPRAARAFTTAEWKDLLLRSVGLEPAALSPRARDVSLLRMVPFVERNYNMVELGPRGTGKSHLFQQVSPYAHLVSGGKATVARMFVNMANGQRGLGLPIRRGLLRRGLGRILRSEGRRQHHEGLHGERRVLARPGEHPRRRVAS